ncbi:MAG: glycosyltransferase [Candidatus Omnitrophica bacterium]|nr:glycosyltransferase [Candidatus Omnitrophota bacterium]
MEHGKEIFIKIIVVITILVSLAYVAVRTALFLFADYTAVEKLFAVMLIAGDLFIILHSIGYAANLLTLYTNRDHERTPKAGMPSGDPPSVALLVPARHEPREVLERTFTSLKNINYANKHVYFLDDSSEEKYKHDAETLARAMGVTLFGRAERHGAKAGIVNDCLKTLTEDYIVIFDADQNPLPEFLNVLIPLMENDKRLAFIQTPQFYSNIDQSRVARGAAFQQAVFYEYICEGKSSGGAMFCCGTNVVFRRQALLEVGGLDESTVTEDFATSLRFHARGWKSLYYNHVYTFGMGPEDLAGYFKQQFRWTTGTISVLKKILWRFLTRPFSLTPIQWWEYLLSGSYYFIGIAFFFLMICPLTYIFFKIPSFFVQPEIYCLSFIPYFVLSIGVFYFLLGKRNYKVRDLFLGQLLASITFSVYIRGAVTALLGIRTPFGVTEKKKGRAISPWRLWPQFSMLFINFIAFVWAVNRFIYELNPAVIVNGIWMFYYFMVLSGIFYFNRDDVRELACKVVPNRLKYEYKILGMAEHYDEGTWKTCITIRLPERLAKGTLVMIKLFVPKGNEAIIFDASVIDSAVRKGFGGFPTNLGVVTIAERDNVKLKEALQ